MNFGQLKRRILVSLIAGVAILMVMGVYSDFRKIVDSFSTFNPKFLPLILMMAPLNYCFRYIKWEYYLSLLGIKMKRSDSLGIFISGLSMTVTPGKLGEFLKSFLIKEFYGTPVSVTSPMVIIERMTDGISLVILAAIGALEFRYGYSVLAAAFAGVVLFIIFIRYRPFARRVISVMKKLPLLKRFAGALDSFYESSYQLLCLGSVLFSIAIGIVSWSFEGIIIYLVLKSFGTPIPVLSSLFIVAFSSVVGAVSMLPGGLLVTEGSIFGLLLMAGVNRQTATVTTIITRFSTLWLGVAVGIGGLIFVQRRLSKPSYTIGKNS